MTICIATDDADKVKQYLRITRRRPSKLAAVRYKSFLITTCILQKDAFKHTISLKSIH
ncbi:hypothetical protein [Niallia sp. NCCP-28]|uniref:hypothetical protein n=1 Tax=Niallia sp. NCCP-28 TaxID=2934712 RepID=UPI00208BBA7E|nr:hypothetical protein [Niallia sp. NCCP-28]GKU82065.1 hypothetical protein NCCP28_14610 [Niallia sp. NCCP-28]